MSRINLFIDTHVWYAYLKVKSRIFADERDKKNFLGFVLQSKKEKGFRVFAFSLLDDEMYFLLGTNEREKEAAALILRDLLEQYGNYYLKSYGKAVQDAIENEAKCLPVHQAEEILDICRCIHRVPMEKGYVKKLEDYWWSSFLTYRGIYPWEFVDTRPVLWYLSDNHEKSDRQFRKLHSCIGSGQSAGGSAGNKQ